MATQEKNHDHLKWKEIGREKVFDGPIFDLYKAHRRSPEGDTTHFLLMDRTPFPEFVLDNPDIVHVAAYGILTALIFLSLSPARRFVFTPLIAVCFGGAAELIQVWVPTRECSWQDLVLNAIGISLTMAFFYIHNRLCRVRP